ncbi:MAG: DNA cytosine methyltransferase [Ginsengibacter sp.]
MTKSSKKLTIKDFAAADIFCGIGGLTHGMIIEDIKIVVGVDLDPTCQFAFEKNNKAKFIHKDVTELSSEELEKYFPPGKRKILVGCAPCQPFSLYNHKSAKDSKKINTDKKWKLLYSFSDLIEKVNPEIVSMENVPMLIKFNKGEVFNDFVDRLKKQGYEVSWQIVNAQDYGVPQRRKRLVLLGSKLGKIDLIETTIKNKNYKTVRETIGHLPLVEDGIAHPDDALHRARKLTDLNKKRIQAMKEGGFWREWDKSLWLKCHSKVTGKDFNSVYGRMKWDDVAPTMTTFCIGINNGRFGHPDQDRAITLREAALLQSFPENYQFIDPKATFNSQNIAKHIGNAVPVGLGIAIAKSIKRHIEIIGTRGYTKY